MMKHTVTCSVTLWLLWFGVNAAAAQPERPNIVIIVADDLVRIRMLEYVDSGQWSFAQCSPVYGWNDVSFHGSNQIPTPNIDALAYDGIILNRHYVPPLCTPSRASLMTGKHPMNIGMQDHVILSDEPWGLGLDQKLMPEYFRDAGYRTHLVGKWHLGFFRRAYTPTYRGFDSHYGYLGPYIDYWDHSLQMNETSARGLDMRRNTDINYSANGIYATDLFNEEAVRIIHTHNESQPLFLVLTHLAPHTGNEDDPMQAPVDEIAKFSYIQDPARQTLAAMIGRIDAGVGRIYRALAERNMLTNTILLFYADNGAPTLGTHANSGSNYPLRGQKESPWEGAVRGAALVWSPLLPGRKGVVSNQWFHVSDWLPTLGHRAGIDIPPTTSTIDGQNQWETLNNATAPGRTVVMNSAQDTFEYSSYIKRGWKYVNGTLFEAYDGWLGQQKESDQLSRAEYYERLIAPGTIGASMQLVRDRVESVRSSATVHCPTGVESNCEPLQKYTPWEGAVRGAALIWSPLLPRKSVVSEQWIHVSDWLPTLAFAAGIGSIPTGTAIDGQNQWLTLQSADSTGRSVVMNNADHKFGYSSYMKLGWKYVNGTCFAGAYDAWLGELVDNSSITEEEYYSRLMDVTSIGSSMQLSHDKVQEIRQSATIGCADEAEEIRCDPLQNPCLFNIVDDPCERRNLADLFPDVLSDLQADVVRYTRNALPRRNKPADGRADPALHNNTWTWWQDAVDEDHASHYILYLAAAVEILIILLIIWCGQKYYTRSGKK